MWNVQERLIIGECIEILPHILSIFVSFHILYIVLHRKIPYFVSYFLR